MIHRDIKLENILVEKDGTVKLIDFAISIHQTEKKSKMSIAGTPQYMAPEVLTGQYGRECDMWSLGVCIYYILTGKLPFRSKTPFRMFSKINSGLFEIPKNISLECLEFLFDSLKVDPLERITAEEALNHKWFKKQKLPIRSPASRATISANAYLEN